MPIIIEITVKGCLISFTHHLISSEPSVLLCNHTIRSHIPHQITTVVTAASFHQHIKSIAISYHLLCIPNTTGCIGEPLTTAVPQIHTRTIFEHPVFAASIDKSIAIIIQRCWCTLLAIVIKVALEKYFISPLHHLHASEPTILLRDHTISIDIPNQILIIHASLTLK